MKKTERSNKNRFLPYILSLFLVRVSAAVITLVFAFFLSLTFEVNINETGIVVISCIVGFSYMAVMVFLRSQKTGALDCDAAADAPIPSKLLKGLLCGLIVEAPFALMAVITFLFSNPSPIPVLMVLLGFFNFHYGWLQLILNHPLIFLPVSLVLPALSWFGYRKGYLGRVSHEPVIQKKSKRS